MGKKAHKLKVCVFKLSSVLNALSILRGKGKDSYVEVSTTNPEFVARIMKDGTIVMRSTLTKKPINDYNCLICSRQGIVKHQHTTNGFIGFPQQVMEKLKENGAEEIIIEKLC